MDFIRKVWDKIKQPNGWYLALFYVFFVCVVTTTIVLVVKVQVQTVLHYVLYFVSAVSLAYFVYSICYFSPIIKKKFIQFLKRHKFTNELLSSFGYRTLVFSIISFILNISYVVFIGVLAFKTLSPWYISITAYYLILIFMKGNIFYSKKKYNTEIKKARAYRFCGIMFILLTIAFSGVIVLIYKSNMYFEYAGLMIYAVALYTFYRLTLSIINIVKAKKQDDLYVQSIRNVNLVSALVSLVVLQVAMFQAFSPQDNLGVANALTGGAVSLVVLGLGIFMIVKANKILKGMEEENEKTK
ncbi:MAG: hypothetical protein IJW32_06035 [Clostridia bacterium]|nr:hypothetical protein [Clostridia bacterium]MBQ9792356.1 hypothetical protein [Clostridia bacterium]MBQ9793274.1 hypothetical protein [Clostridia bacterium]